MSPTASSELPQGRVMLRHLFVRVQIGQEEKLQVNTLATLALKYI